MADANQDTITREREIKDAARAYWRVVVGDAHCRMVSPFADAVVDALYKHAIGLLDVTFHALNTGDKDGKPHA